MVRIILKTVSVVRDKFLKVYSSAYQAILNQPNNCYKVVQFLNGNEENSFYLWKVTVKVVRLIAAIYDIAILHSSKHALQVITKNVQYVKI